MVAVAALTVSKKRMSEKPKKLRSIVKACNKEAEPKFFHKPNFVQQIKKGVLHITKLVLNVGVP